MRPKINPVVPEIARLLPRPEVERLDALEQAWLIMLEAADAARLVGNFALADDLEEQGEVIARQIEDLVAEIEEIGAIEAAALEEEPSLEGDLAAVWADWVAYQQGELPGQGAPYLTPEDVYFAVRRVLVSWRHLGPESFIPLPKALRAAEDAWLERRRGYGRERMAGYHWER